MLKLFLGIIFSKVLAGSATGFDHDGIYVADYCPKMEHCDGGTHIMCMYYEPGKKWGNHCNEPMENITMTPEIANDLLNLVNGIRSKLALEEEMGKDKTALPKAYGVYRLKWDNELATFAQVMANQCIMKRDICRATKRFDNPGQTVGLYRFTHPDWLALTNTQFSSRGLTSEKINFAVTNILKHWYLKKADVTLDMISAAPDYSMKDVAGRPYLEMIYGPATHMGCGIASFTEYYNYHHRNGSQLIYNVIIIYCNYSARPKHGTSVYNVTPSLSSSHRCGCPLGTHEDNDCLCNEISGSSLQSHWCEIVERKLASDVILPIFSQKQTESLELFNVPRSSGIKNMLDRNRRIGNSKEHKTAKSGNESDDWLSDNIPKIPRRYHESHGEKLREAFLRETQRERRKSLSRYQSIATRTQSSMPDRKANKFDAIKKSKGPIKHDVVPRKDFGKIKSIVEKYLSDKKKSNKIGDKHDCSKIQKIFTNNDIENILKNVDNPATNDDDKLKSLLDNLEHELKFIKLDNTKKKIIESKFRRIYENILGNDNSEQSYGYGRNNIRKGIRRILNSEEFVHENVKKNEEMDTERLNRQFERNQYVLFGNDNHQNYENNRNRLSSVDKEIMKRLMQRNFYLNYNNENSLSFERAKYYEDKLNEIQKKLDVIKNSELNARNYQEKYGTKRRIEDHPYLSDKIPVDPVYVPDRARSILGY